MSTGDLTHEHSMLVFAQITKGTPAHSSSRRPEDPSGAWSQPFTTTSFHVNRCWSTEMQICCCLCFFQPDTKSCHRLHMVRYSKQSGVFFLPDRIMQWRLIEAHRSDSHRNVFRWDLHKQVSDCSL